MNGEHNLPQGKRRVFLSRQEGSVFPILLPAPTSGGHMYHLHRFVLLILRASSLSPSSSCTECVWKGFPQPGATSLKKTHSPFHRSHLLPTASQLRVGLGSPSSPMLGFVWLDLTQGFCVYSQPLWADVNNSSVMSSKYCFTADIHYR